MNHLDHWGYKVVHCPICGIRVIPGQKYCSECGGRINDEGYGKDDGADGKRRGCRDSDGEYDHDRKRPDRNKTDE